MNTAHKNNNAENLQPLDGMPKQAVERLHQGLFFDSISKAFGGTQALSAVSMHVERGEIVALLGENGAGKSTLIKILGGIHQPDTGAVMVDGANYNHKTGNINAAQDVAFIHQDLGLIEWMTIAENMSIAQGYVSNKLGLIDWASSERFAEEALARIGVAFDPSARIQSLTRAEKSMVAIARALAVKCQFLVLDEPSASLPAADVERLFKVLRQLKDDGVGMIYVSHRLDEIFTIADRVVVLRDGKMVGVRDVAHTSPEELVDLIVGRKPKVFDKPKTDKNNKVLEVNGLIGKQVGPVSFTAYSGEILGLVGLRGAGQEDIGRCIFGDMSFSGELTLMGEPLKPKSPREAIAQGVGLIAGDRVVESNASALSIQENMFVNLCALGHHLCSWRSPAKEYDEAKLVGQMVGLKPNKPELPIESLSGGNQQKVIVGRWLQMNNKILIAEDPTAGVDVGAKAEIYELLSSLMKRGISVLVISTDFEEVATICHRAIVFNRGQIMTTLSGFNLTTESLIQAASAGEQ